MAKPAKFKVGPLTYSVVYDQSSLERATDKNCGICLDDRLEVLIHPDLPKDKLAETMMHEVLHAVWAFCGMDEKHEEDTVTRMAPALLGVLRDNKALVEWLSS